MKVRRIKKAGSGNCLPENEKGEISLDVGLGLTQTLHAIACFPLTAFFEQIDAFETLQNVALNYETADTLEAFVL